MFRFLVPSTRFIPSFAVGSAFNPNSLLVRFFGSKAPTINLPKGFITVPEDKIHIDVRRQGRIDGSCFRRSACVDMNSEKSSVNRVILSFNVGSATWMPEYVFLMMTLCSSDIKEIFKDQQASHIDPEGNFVLVSSLHRSLVANRVEGMKKLQKKVNHAYITKRRKEGATGNFAGL